MQVDIFNLLYPTYKITKPIRLIELFGGYGSQHFALKYIGADVEHWKLCEWAVKSIQAYKDAHCYEDDTDYSKDMTKEELIDYLYKKGISSNYNEPMTLQQIKRQNEKWLKTVYNNIISTKNLVNIQQVKGKDLGIVETDKYEYIMTYSFPCQDLSLAGKRKGMSDTSTRSGLLWEVERILDECEELPQVLLMENVPQVIGAENVEHFNKWQRKLEKLGYKNYHQNLIATDYGIPQTRNRTFMISILGDYSYSFPDKIPLKLKLKDMLEDNVDEKYYLSDKFLNYCTDMTYRNGFVRGERFNPINPEINDKAYTVTTGAGNRPTDNFIIIPEDTKKGYVKAKDGDGVYINRPHQKRGCVQKDKIQTLKTSVDDIGVVVKDNLKTQLCNKLIKENKVKENDIIRHSYSNSRLDEWEKRSVEQNNLSPTLDTRCDCLGITTKEQEQLRIRKLTPLEVFRLMGVKDEDYERIAQNQSNSSLYHLAGDSIVINVLMTIFKELIKC